MTNDPTDDPTHAPTHDAARAPIHEPAEIPGDPCPPETAPRENDDENADEDESPRTVVETIAAIKEGRLNPRSVDAETRRECTDYLLGEGASRADIAALLRCSDKTVQRDLAQLRARNAVRADPELGPRLAGQMVTELDRCAQRARRAAREPAASPRDRIDAERLVLEMIKLTIETLQSMGYVPRAAQKLDATVSAVTVAAALGEIDRLSVLADGQDDVRSVLDSLRAAAPAVPVPERALEPAAAGAPEPIPGPRLESGDAR